MSEAVLFLDGDGAARHWKYPGAYSEQPASDMAIHRFIQGRWVELRNRAMESKR